MELEEAATERGSSGGDADRLSALPDSLLHTVMSFLKARQVVQTCVLSARWRHLWRSVPCLDVDHDEFRNSVASAPSNHPAAVNDFSDSDVDSYEDSEDDNDDSDDNRQREWENFDDFAESLMHRFNVAQLDSLRLRVNRARAPSFADRSRWVAASRDEVLHPGSSPPGTELQFLAPQEAVSLQCGSGRSFRGACRFSVPLIGGSGAGGLHMWDSFNHLPLTEELSSEKLQMAPPF